MKRNNSGGAFEATERLEYEPMTRKIANDKKDMPKIEQLVAAIAELRSDRGCPWDKEQTHESLAPFLLEEVYEVLEAIHLDDHDKLQEELGDLLLQIVMHAQIASETKAFDLNSIAAAINEKMLRRHPHVFGDVDLKTADAVVAQWEELKEQELKDARLKGGQKSSLFSDKVKSDSETNHSALDGVPNVMPALLKSLKISQRAVRQGFDWQSEEGIWEQLNSELEELKEAIAHYEKHGCGKNVSNKSRAGSLQALKLELGDVLFTVVNLARWHQLDPEEALLLSTEKFKRRFQCMEKLSPRPLKELTITELEQLWQRVKSKNI